MHPDRFRGVVSISIPFAPRGEWSQWDQLRADGLGERYCTFDIMKPGAEAGFRACCGVIPRTLHWLSASPPPQERWDPVDPAKHMLRPVSIDIPYWADPDYVRHKV